MKDWKLGHQGQCRSKPFPDIADQPQLPWASVYPQDQLTAACQTRRNPGVPAGLVNLGDTCYMNATLQCLMHVPAIQAAFAIGKHSDACPLKVIFFIISEQGRGEREGRESRRERERKRERKERECGGKRCFWGRRSTDAGH